MNSVMVSYNNNHQTATNTNDLSHYKLGCLKANSTSIQMKPNEVYGVISNTNDNGIVQECLLVFHIYRFH